MMHPASSRRLAVAPMMGWTDRHDRFFLRLISRRVRLYSEMLTVGAIQHGDRARLLGFEAAEHPVALQIGGADPQKMAECARIAEDWGYDEVNINVGCPSGRVQSGGFGACLMQAPGLVAECVARMQAAVAIPVTVKCRTGIDADDPETALPNFVDQVAAAGCAVFIIHARKAWLQGLNPEQNRNIPPLNHALVQQIKRARPDLTIIVNGGIDTLTDAALHLEHLDGVMIGRAAYRDPWLLAAADRRFFGAATAVPDRLDVVEAMAEYAARQMAMGVPLKSITRHMTGLFQGLPGARSWRRMLSQEVHKPGVTPALLRRAAACVAPEPTPEPTPAPEPTPEPTPLPDEVAA